MQTMQKDPDYDAALTDEELARMSPAAEVLPAEFLAMAQAKKNPAAAEPDGAQVLDGAASTESRNTDG